MRAFLIYRNTDGLDTTVELERDDVTIGRNPDNIISTLNASVGRYHGRVLYFGGSYWCAHPKGAEKLAPGGIKLNEKRIVLRAFGRLRHRFQMRFGVFLINFYTDPRPLEPEEQEAMRIAATTTHSTIPADRLLRETQNGNTFAAHQLYREAERRQDHHLMLLALMAMEPTHTRWKTIRKVLDRLSDEAVVKHLEMYTQALESWPDQLRYPSETWIEDVRKPSVLEQPRFALVRALHIDLPSFYYTVRRPRAWVSDLREDAAACIRSLRIDLFIGTSTEFFDSILNEPEHLHIRRIAVSLDTRPESAQQVIRLIGAHVQRWERLDLRNSELGSELIDALLSTHPFTDLTHLTLKNTRITTRDAHRLLNHPEHFPALRQLDLRSNLLGPSFDASNTRIGPQLQRIRLDGNDHRLASSTQPTPIDKTRIRAHITAPNCTDTAAVDLDIEGRCFAPEHLLQPRELQPLIYKALIEVLDDGTLAVFDEDNEPHRLTSEHDFEVDGYTIRVERLLTPREPP